MKYAFRSRQDSQSKIIGKLKQKIKEWRVNVSNFFIGCFLLTLKTEKSRILPQSVGNTLNEKKEYFFLFLLAARTIFSFSLLQFNLLLPIFLSVFNCWTAFLLLLFLSWKHLKNKNCRAICCLTIQYYNLSDMERINSEINKLSIT